MKLEQGFDRVARRGLRLHQHRLSDADRHAGDGGGLPADRDWRKSRDRRIHALDLPGVGDRAAAVVAGGGDRDSLPRLPAAARISRSRAGHRWPRGCRRAARPSREPTPRAAAHGDHDASTTRRSTAASARWSAGACARGAVLGVDARACSCWRSSASRFVPQQFFPAPTGPSCWSTCGCRKEPRSPRRCARPSAWRRSSTRDRGIDNYVDYVGAGQPALLPAARPAARQRRTSPSSWSRPRTSRSASALRARLDQAAATTISRRCAARVSGWRTARRSASRCSSASPATTSRRCARSPSRSRR